MQNITDKEVVAVDDTATVTTPVETASEAVPASKKKKKTKKQKAKKAAKFVPVDPAVHLQNILDQLYVLRADTKFWANMRNSQKAGEALHKLLIKEPNYRWRQVGMSYYLEAKHTGDDKTVAFILPFNPRRDYEQRMRDYKKALDKQTKKSKAIEIPAKPTDMKPCYQWHIASRRGDDTTEGMCMKFDEAKQAVMDRQNLFVV